MNYRGLATAVLAGAWRELEAGSSSPLLLKEGGGIWSDWLELDPDDVRRRAAAVARERRRGYWKGRRKNDWRMPYMP